MKSRALDRRGFQVVEVPWPVQVWAHGACRTAWPGSPCTCGRYALQWRMKAAAWAQKEGSAMPLDLVPDNRGILAILEASIDGPYRFVHHALIPYVRIGPAGPVAEIFVRASRELCLLPSMGNVRVLRGEAATMDLAVVFRGAGIELREVPHRAAALNQLAWSQQQRLPMPEEPVRRRPRQRVMRTMPVAGGQSPPRVTRPRVEVRDTAVPRPVVIPEAWREFCAAQDVHPELGDYVVIPEGDVLAQAPREWWMVTHPEITEVQVVQPRLER